MTGDELAQPLRRTLRAKAEQVPADAPPFDPAVSAFETAPPRRSPWALAIAAAIVVVLGAAAVALAVRARSGPDVSAVSSTTTTTEPLDLTVRVLPGWPDIPDAAPDGSVPVDQFNAALDTQRPAWATAANVVALAYTHFPQDVALEKGTVTATRTNDGLGRRRIQLTHEGVGDDSIAAERYDLELTQQLDGRWQVASAQWSQRCQPNRGHQDFTTEECA